MGYWTYYLGWFLLAYAMRYPYLAVGALLFYALRGYIPDPFVFFATLGRIGALKTEIAANPANVRARRDLATIYLQRLRPRAALRLLDEARQRHPDDAELLYLTGLARLRSGDHEGALEPLVRAVDIDPRIRFGEPYMAAASALIALGRLEEAEDALERYAASNSSSVEAFVRLSSVRSARGDRDGAKQALGEALSTWSAVPGYQRRKAFGWWLRAQLARVIL